MSIQSVASASPPPQYSLLQRVSPRLSSPIRHKRMLISALAATAGAAALGCVVRPTVSPIALRVVEVVEYLALAAVVPLACWVGGIYGWAREMNLI